MEFTKYVKIRSERFGAVVFETQREKVYVTNETGGEILHLLADGLDAAAIARRLGERYARAPGEIEPDIAAFVEAALSAGLLAPAAEEQS